MHGQPHIRNKCNSTTYKNPAYKTLLGGNTKTLKIMHIICILIALSITKRWTVQTEMK